jgi:hypothetical protein
MNPIDLKSIGITEEELQQRVVDAIVNRMLSSTAFNYDEGQSFTTASPVYRKIQESIKSAIDAKFDMFFESHVCPLVGTKIDDLVIQKTNEWGEKRGEPVTFLEYLIEQAEKHLNEPLDARGRTRSQCAATRDSFNPVRGSTRLANAIDQKIAMHLEQCVTIVVRDATDKVGTAMQDVLKNALETAKDKIKVKIS